MGATLFPLRFRIPLAAALAIVPPAAASAETATQRILADVTLMKTIGAAFAVLLAYTGMFLIVQLTVWLSEKVVRRYRLLIKQSVPFLKGLILIVTFSYLLDQFLNLTQNNLLALTGTLAVALGFAFKDYVGLIIAGVVSLFDASYRVGDWVRIGDHYGEVVGYGLRSLQLLTPRRQHHHHPPQSALDRSDLQCQQRQAGGPGGHGCLFRPHGRCRSGGGHSLPGALQQSIHPVAAAHRGGDGGAPLGYPVPLALLFHGYPR